MEHSLFYLTDFVVTPSLHLKKSCCLIQLCVVRQKITSDCLERKIILMLKLLNGNYYTAMYIAITWGLH